MKYINEKKSKEVLSKPYKLQHNLQDLSMAFVDGFKNVITSVKHIAPSGLSRVVTFYIVTPDGLSCIDDDICEVLGYKWDSKYRGIRIRGCGTDVIYDTLYYWTNTLDIPWSQNYFNI